MKITSSVFLLCFFVVFFSSAEDVETLLKKNQKSAVPEFPAIDAGPFESLHEAALKGDASAGTKLFGLVFSHIKAVYRPLKPLGGLLFSSRKPIRGFGESENNYAVNISDFFEETTDKVRVRKRGFDVHTLDGASYPISYLQYKSSSKAIQFKNGAETSLIPLAELTEKDQFFVRNALVDELFDSREFEVSVDDKRFRAEEAETKKRNVHFDNGETLNESFSSAEAKEMNRSIVLENKGHHPLKNLIVEYQAFVEQTIMKMPKDFPEDYRCVGCFEVASLAPGEVKRLPLKLPATINARMESVQDGDYEYSIVLPSDVNQKSKGRMNGIWVRVHRITPYGERLTREHESSGVPSTDWENVAPAGADIR